MTPGMRRLVRFAVFIFWSRVFFLVFDCVVAAALLWLAIFFFMNGGVTSSALMTGVVFWHSRTFARDLNDVKHGWRALRQMRRTFRGPS